MDESLPDPIEKRDLIYGDDVDQETRRKTGDHFFEEGYLVDALDAYEEADHEEGGEQIRQKAIDQGNYFRLSRIRRIWPDLVQKQHLERAVDNAENNGRYTDAIKLLHAAGQSSAADRMEQRLKEETGTTIPEVVRKDIADAKEKDEVD